MMATATTLVLTVGSAALLVYWFHYTCIMLLSAKTTRDFTQDVVEANQLSFLQVQQQLQGSALPVNLDQLQAALDRDYEVVTYLISHTPGAESQLHVEDRMLQLNYRISQVWYQVGRRVAPNAARQSLEHMSAVVAHFANTMGERSAEVGA